VTALAEEYRARCELSLSANDVREQMPVLFKRASLPGVRIIELGVRAGNSTAAFLAAAEEQDGQLWSVDIAAPAVPAWWLGLPFWHLTVADDTSETAIAACPDGADVLFIDTSHGYDHTLAELRAYAPKVAPGGVILAHDTDYAEWPGVPLALNTWCRETGRSWTDLGGAHGLGVIEIPGGVP
jgi:predicted O-methyltransferase YrrM